MQNEEKIKKSFELLKGDLDSIKSEIKHISDNISKFNSQKEQTSTPKEDFSHFYENKTIMITGGLGFIGSNLAHHLIQFNPKKIIIVDSLVKGLGGNIHNIDGIDKSKLTVYSGEKWDLRNIDSMKKCLTEVDYIFNLAGSVSHIGSKENPVFDLELNLRSHLHLLEACRQVIKESKKSIKVVYAGSRDQYGKVKERFLPISEDYLIDEVSDPQGINKGATEFYHLWYRQVGLKTCSLRLSNIYGPRHIMTDAGQGFMNWFVRQAIDDETIELWGGGEPLRDLLYVDDVVKALLMAMASDKTDGKVYNLGVYRKKGGLYEQLGGNIKSIREVAEKIVEIAGTGKIKIIPYPEDRKQLEVGHFYSDATKIYQDIGWEAETTLNEGIMKTLSFYRKYKDKYWK